jgi:hypothetical protein
MIVQEQAGSNVEGDENVYGIVFVSGEDEEYSKHVQEPGESVKEIHSAGSICLEQSVIIIFHLY